ncbi:glycosyltransferase family 1 protein [Polynucleobacter paneuropaeus]|jgi:hypothetical protein|nr:glycosyltransferase family 1 protein [Polynucleobacter paneuropaeus]QWD12987.1 glycosyltransferase family 1 protein [Polynucleobacter paneuropaeus]QWD39319.1 glycosyltransferase family 1 protein [Polynucleobacter paneuropaeus]
MQKTLSRRIIKLKRSYQKARFNWGLNRQTRSRREIILKEAEAALSQQKILESEVAYAQSHDPLVIQGHELQLQILQAFSKQFSGKSDERVLIQVPSPSSSPAGYSLFSNLVESLNFIGIPSQALGWDEDSKQVIESFNPTTLLSSDHYTYLERIDWQHIKQYKVSRPLKVGLTASLAEYDNSPLGERLQWAKTHKIDFFYSFRDEAYFNSRLEYKPFFEAGYQILSIPFGANILYYYPVPSIPKDLYYALMASRKREHISYMDQIARKYSGFIDGPGWNHIQNFTFNRQRDRYIYARAKIGLNIHLPEQLEWACELNERTYQLAACGLPQLIDRPLLLNKVFTEDMIFSAANPKEFTELFEYILKYPEIAQAKALKAQQEVFTKYTTFHRAASFIEQLKLI